VIKLFKYSSGGIIMIVVGRLAAAGRLPRNLLVGIRIPSTMRSDEAWMAGHQAAASALTVGGFGPIAAGIVALLAKPSRDKQAALLRVGMLWLLAWVGVATLQAGRAARTESSEATSA